MKKSLFVIGVCCAFTLVGCTKLNEEETETEITEEELYELAENFEEQDYKTFHELLESESTVTTLGTSTTGETVLEYITDVETSGDYYYYYKSSAVSSGSDSTYRIEMLPLDGSTYNAIVDYYSTITESSYTSEMAESIILADHEEWLSTCWFDKDALETLLSTVDGSEIEVDSEGNITIAFEMDANSYLTLSGMDSLMTDGTGTFDFEIVLNEYGYLTREKVTSNDFGYSVFGITCTSEITTTQTCTYGEAVDKTQKIIVS